MQSYTEDSIGFRLQKVQILLEELNSAFYLCSIIRQSYDTREFRRTLYSSPELLHEQPYFRMDITQKRYSNSALNGVLNEEISLIKKKTIKKGKTQSRETTYKKDFLTFLLDKQPPPTLGFSLVMMTLMTHNTGINHLELAKSDAPESQIFAKLMAATKSDPPREVLEQREKELIAFYKKHTMKILLRHISRWYKDKKLVFPGDIKLHSDRVERESQEALIVVKSLIFPEYNRFANLAVKQIMGHDRPKNHLPYDTRLRTLNAVLANFCISLPARLFEMLSRYFETRTMHSLQSFTDDYGQLLQQAMLKELNLYPKDRGLKIDTKISLESSLRMVERVTATMGSIPLTLSGREQFLRSRPPAESLPEAFPSLIASLNDRKQVCFSSFFRFSTDAIQDMAPDENGVLQMLIQQGAQVPTCKRRITNWKINREVLLDLKVMSLPRLIEEAYGLKPGTILGTSITNKFRLRVDETFEPRANEEKGTPRSLFQVKGIGELEALVGILLRYMRVEQFNAGM
ncbi:uncharacterized protein SAPINGB_P002877 [Magnusiomyces paraingens]|uniref:Uncharacterized protein n=1 Tax=Magnusiomyces paraingens TaxID=2606893 RepID=A0A5E8BM79_9ASCO|nr:uncharacterized protein SAPINGB_P002877 [Saprochaete ingens]VVT50778.1 unnamed protein product [Saprochaete ingens]